MFMPVLQTLNTSWDKAGTSTKDQRRCCRAESSCNVRNEGRASFRNSVLMCPQQKVKQTSLKVEEQHDQRCLIYLRPATETLITALSGTYRPRFVSMSTNIFFIRTIYYYSVSWGSLWSWQYYLRQHWGHSHSRGVKQKPGAQNTPTKIQPAGGFGKRKGGHQIWW